MAEFDGFALKYDEALKRGIAVSGEDKEFFAKGRVARVGRMLRSIGSNPKRILDFGCGTGSAIPHLLTLGDLVQGVDVSNASLEVARSQFSGDWRIEFQPLASFKGDADFDLVFCNGVFHHIPLKDRDQAVSVVRRALKPGGLFAFWENNPWNPGTRLVMSRIPFDRDAIPLSPIEGKRLLKSGGFEILRQEFHFYFPRCLAALRVFEGALKYLPFGAQYLVIGKK